MTIDWAKLGAGVPDVPTYEALLARVGRGVPPDVEPPEGWALGSRVHALDYEPKNKPFLLPEPTLPSEAEGLLRRAPHRLADARYLLVKFAPCHDPRYAGQDVVGGCYGCKTDSIADFGHVYSSKTSLVGFVEGIVSSLANWKLYALALTHHAWTDEVLTCDGDPEFLSPLRAGEPATAGTVLHTAYCSAHLLDWYHRLAETGPLPHGAAQRTQEWTERAARSIVALETLSGHMTPHGAMLIGALRTWCEALVEATV
jgi:hypothetical protein